VPPVSAILLRYVGIFSTVIAFIVDSVLQQHCSQHVAAGALHHTREAPPCCASLLLPLQLLHHIQEQTTAALHKHFACFS
jgi:hypothetical protein